MPNVCGNCSKEIGDVTFCPFCGLPQQCTNCGTTFESNERFCGNCGTKRINPAEQEESEQTVDESTESQAESAEEQTTATKEDAREQVAATESAQTSEVENVQQSEGQREGTAARADVQQGANIQQTQAPQQGEQQTSKFKMPAFAIGAIVIIGVVIAYFAGGFASEEKKVENTITAYMDAVGEFDFDKVEKLHHPHSPYIDDLNDFSDFPFDIEIEVHRIYDIDIYDDYADAVILMSVSSPSYGDERYTDELYVELEKHKRKWHIYDIY